MKFHILNNNFQNSIKFKNFSLNIKTYTEENEKELASIKNELKNFEEKLGSKVK